MSQAIPNVGLFDGKLDCVLQWRALRYLVIILQILPLAGKSPKRHRDLWGNESESNVVAVAAVVAVFVLSACCASSV